MNQHEHQYDQSKLNPYDYDSTRSTGGNGCRNVAIGCGLVSLVGVGVMVVGGLFVARNARPWTAKTVVSGIEQVVAESDLPEEQQEQIVVRARALGEDFASGEVSLEELVQIGERIAKSRSIVAGGVEFIVRKMVEDKAELDEAQTEQVNRLVQRLARGIAEEKLEKQDFEPLMEIVLVKKGEDHYEVKNDLSKEEIAKFLVELETMVDTAEIPDEPYEVDIASEIDNIIEEVTDTE